MWSFAMLRDNFVDFVFVCNLSFQFLCYIRFLKWQTKRERKISPHERWLTSCESQHSRTKSSPHFDHLTFRLHMKDIYYTLRRDAKMSSLREGSRESWMKESVEHGISNKLGTWRIQFNRRNVTYVRNDSDFALTHSRSCLFFPKRRRQQPLYSLDDLNSARYRMEKRLNRVESYIV